MGQLVIKSKEGAVTPVTQFDLDAITTVLPGRRPADGWMMIIRSKYSVYSPILSEVSSDSQNSD